MPLRRIVMPTRGQLMGIGIKARAAEGRAQNLMAGMGRLGAGFRAGAESAKQTRQFDRRMDQQESQFSRGLSLRKDRFNYDKFSDTRMFGLQEQRVRLESVRLGTTNMSIALNAALSQKQSAGAVLADLQYSAGPQDPDLLAARKSYDEAAGRVDSLSTGIQNAISSANTLFKKSTAPDETPGGVECKGPT